jgi:NAD(P)-dependent dehydrogenase (short-subunit alcohol dehydrogenase family)
MTVFDMKGRVALVTGGGRGIGRAIAETFAQAGARVAITARTQSELAETRAALRQHSQAEAIVADLADRSAPAGVVSEVREKLGPVEILVNNAGIGSSANPRPVAEFDDTFWDLTIAVNLTAVYLLCKAVLPDMLRAKWGRIINVSSINGRVPAFHGVAYTASKHGVLGVTRTLAVEVARDGITVNAICPGPVKTRMNDRRVEYDAKRRGVSFAEQEASMTPIGRRLLPEEVAPLALFLASDEARAITGQAWNVCGGMVPS